MKLLLATSNAGKIREMCRVLAGLPLEIVSLREFKNVTPARETGTSFAANARIKARTYYRQTGLLTLAEDSGLQVDCLGGLPGHLSARFAGDGSSDADNVKKLLRLMRGVRAERRAARFVCVVAVTDGKRIWLATGKCEGRIASRALGNSGFGYDPLFIPEGYNTTFARLGAKTKNEISHRAGSLKKARRILERLLAERSEKDESIRAKPRRAGT
ncbi:MAG: RdgB/HAM1 family non-canonical purine NTP pyrophosphatase [Candidatus Hydrogenedentota bacterium]|nr:MAG: RdgB/HAM1 family non-canonical purine NTP pyrophosphatase [Candidatus Hydrogenedentota bacterium]